LSPNPKTHEDLLLGLEISRSGAAYASTGRRGVGQQTLLAARWASGHEVSMVTADYGQPMPSLGALRLKYRPEAGLPLLRFLHPMEVCDGAGAADGAV